MKYLLACICIPLAKPIQYKNSSRQLLWMMLICLPLLGCHSPSATDTENDSDLESDPVATEAQKLSLMSAVQEEIDEDEAVEDEGTSLMDSAKAGDNEKHQRSPMVAEKATDSVLQATLIGNYAGIVPCANCDEITLMINLYSDGTVKRTEIYENSATSQSPLIKTGIYRQDNNVITIVYNKDSIDIYRIQDNHLIMLDKSNKPNPDYTLSRQ